MPEPSGSQAAVVSGPSTRMAAARSFRGTPQTRTVWSRLVVASQAPSGAIAQPVTALVWPGRVAGQVPVSTSHSRTVWSRLVVASQVPSGAIAQPVTALVWPVRVAVQVPVATSHSRTV